MANKTTKNETQITVVVPFFNRSKFLKRLLDSIKAQSLLPSEIYIVDNGSTLSEINEAWKVIINHDLSNIICFTSSLNKCNANYARNTGYKLANTQFVAFLDSDDWWENDHLLTSTNYLKLNNKAAVYSGAIIHSKTSTSVNKSIDVNNFDNPFAVIMSPNHHIAQTSSFVVDKSILSYKVLWDESLRRHQDKDYFVSIFYNTTGWCYKPEVTTNIDWKQGGTRPEDIDFSSLISFYKKWSNDIPIEFKKQYLIGMLFLAYNYNSNLEVKSFYQTEIINQGYFNDFFYRIRSKSFYINPRNKILNILDDLGLKELVKSVIKFPKKITH